jgi:hypothetical protein
MLLFCNQTKVIILEPKGIVGNTVDPEEVSLEVSGWKDGRVEL